MYCVSVNPTNPNYSAYPKVCIAIVEQALLKVRSLSCIIFASQGLRFGSSFSTPLADLECILRIRALIFHWLRLPVHVSNQKTFYTEHMLSKKCKQRWQRPQSCVEILTKRSRRALKLHLVDSKCFQIKFITNKFFFTGRCHFQLSNIRITKRF